LIQVNCQESVGTRFGLRLIQPTLRRRGFDTRGRSVNGEGRRRLRAMAGSGRGSPSGSTANAWTAGRLGRWQATQCGSAGYRPVRGSQACSTGPRQRTQWPLGAKHTSSRWPQGQIYSTKARSSSRIGRCPSQDHGGHAARGHRCAERPEPRGQSSRIRTSEFEFRNEARLKS